MYIRWIQYSNILAVASLAVALSTARANDEVSPITATVLEGRGFATFTNRAHEGNRIGYRFHEHTPLVCGDVPADAAEAGIDVEAVNRLEEFFSKRAGVVSHRVSMGDKDWTPQQWMFYLAPVADGVEMLWVVATSDVGLNQYYAVQQCFRLGGVSNEKWRREIAETPAFSEYDLWNVMQKDSTAKTSLAHVLRKGLWSPLPAVIETVGARTPLGVAMDTLLSGGNIDSMKKVGPYDALMLAPIDNGLVTRVDLGQTWVCGIYWEHTTHVTDHHPADCLHSIVNLGGIPAHSKRALGGKIYWFRGTLGELEKRASADFGTR